MKLKVYSANIFKYSINQQKLRDSITAADADILFLYELSEQDATWLSQQFSEYSYVVYQKGPENWAQNIAILSQIPFEHTVQYFSSEEPVITTTVTNNQSELHFIAAHPLPPFTPQIATGRKQHLQGLAEYIGSIDGRVVVIGDLNITEFSPLFSDFRDTSNTKSFRSNQGLFGTWPAQLPAPLRIGIDHVLYKGAMQPRVTIGEPNGSDHLPLILEI
ncbi:MAG: endonuclease/exonuclease/phosphatase family protein [Pseudomonadales bacterium]|nr:endonuclease/exonuclease/phosphatase family protein [Pseudomonadales bacterium]